MHWYTASGINLENPITGFSLDLFLVPSHTGFELQTYFSFSWLYVLAAQYVAQATNGYLELIFFKMSYFVTSRHIPQPHG